MSSPIDTIILETNQTNRAGEILRRGGLVVFPTETVYGLGADATDSRACARIFDAKGRPADNPLIVHLADLEKLGTVAAEPLPLAVDLLRRFSPGPFTVVVGRSTAVPDIVTAGLDTVAVRIPSDPVAQAIIRAAGRPIAAPSANRSGRPSPTDFESACQHMSGRVEAIVRGGQCTVGLESTIVRVVLDNGKQRVELLREGAITLEMIVGFVPSEIVVVAQAVGSTGSAGAELSAQRIGTVNPDGIAGESARVAAVAPGTRHRHYQPKAEVRLFEAAQVRSVVSIAGSRPSALLLLHASLPNETSRRHGLRDIPSRAVIRFDSMEHYGRELYRAFRECDRAGCEIIFAELPPPKGLGRALRDRLFRASGIE